MDEKRSVNFQYLIGHVKCSVKKIAHLKTKTWMRKWLHIYASLIWSSLGMWYGKNSTRSIHFAIEWTIFFFFKYNLNINNVFQIAPLYSQIRIMPQLVEMVLRYYGSSFKHKREDHGWDQCCNNLNDEGSHQLKRLNSIISMSAQARGESAKKCKRVQKMHKKPGARWMRDMKVCKWLKGFKEKAR